MTARSLPTAPSWTTNQEITSSLLNQISTYMTFFANPPCFRAEQHTTQSVATATNTQITCDTTIHDSDSGLSTSTPFSYVVPFAGIWDFFGGVGYVSNTTGIRIPMIWQNGAVINGGGSDQAEVATTALSEVQVAGIPCNVGDVIALYSYQTSGSSLATAPVGGQCSWFAGRLVSLQSP
jgi:hypothetical protein